MSNILAEPIEAVAIDLNYIKHVISNSRFELGDDPEKLDDISRHLGNIKLVLDRLADQFLGTHLSVSNVYFDCVYRTNQALDLINTVKQENLGSTKRTSEFLGIINNYLNYLNQQAKIASIQIFPYEENLKNLAKYLEKLKPTHPSHQRLKTLRKHLEAVWKQGKKTNSKKFRQIISDLDALSISSGGPSFNELKTQSDIVIPPLEEPIPIENCWALIVGVGIHSSDYYGKLPHAANDAWEMSKVLLASKKYNPERTILLATEEKADSEFPENISQGNPDWKKTLHTLETFSKKPAPDDLLLFYFSGHGELDSKRNPYIILHDTDANLLDRTAISMAYIKEVIKKSPAAVKIIILDTCHSGAIMPSKSKLKMRASFIKRAFEAARGIAILTSCSAKQLSFPYDKKKTISAFTHFLIEALKTGDRRGSGFVTGNDLNVHLIAEVGEWSENNYAPQTPKYYFEGEGDPIIVDWRN
jgi:hypothetical protein